MLFCKQTVTVGNYLSFTLAEVLITLCIIGVVAAITLPSLIQHNIEKQCVAQLKNAYSELSQTWNLAVEEFGAPTEWGMGEMYEEQSHYIMASNMRKFLKLCVLVFASDKPNITCYVFNNSFTYGTCQKSIHFGFISRPKNY